MTARTLTVVTVVVGVTIFAGRTYTTAQVNAEPDVRREGADKWVTVEAAAAGMDLNARDEAVRQALRKAVEQVCGVFLTGKSKTRDYKLIYDKIFASAVGYVKEHKLLKSWLEDGKTYVRVRALVSTQKFEQSWAEIAHTVHQEGNPRVIIVIGEATEEMVNTLVEESESSSESTTTTTVESQATVTSAQVAEATRLGEAYVWTDTRGRRWRRTRRRVHCISGERVTAAEIASAEAHFRAVAVKVAAAKSRSARKVWKNVAKTLKEKGLVQGRIEEFFLEKNIKLMDRSTARKVSKRDLMLAMAKEDPSVVRALGAKLNADVIIFGSAAAKHSREVTIAQVKMHQYTARLVVRVIRTDSGQLLASKVFGPITHTSTLKSGGEQKALDKLAKDSAPKLLSAVVEAWRKQVNVSRDIHLQITGMDFDAWKLFKKELTAVRGVEALRLREITESVASIDVEYRYSNENLATRISELKTIKLKVTQITANRLKLKVVE